MTTDTLTRKPASTTKRTLKLLPTSQGLTLAGVLVIKRAPNGTLAIKGNENGIMAKLSVASGKPISMNTMRCLRRAGYWFARVSDRDLKYADYPLFPSPHQPITKQGDEFPAIVMLQTSLELSGFSVVGDEKLVKARLLQTQDLLKNGMSAAKLLKHLGLPTYAQMSKDEGDDSSGDDSGDDSSDSSDSSSDSSSDDSNDDFNAKHPRWSKDDAPPDRRPGEFKPKDGSDASASDPTSPASNRASTPTDDMRNAPAASPDASSNPPQSIQVAADTSAQSDAPTLPNVVQTQAEDEWQRAWVGRPNQKLLEFIANQEQPDVEDHPSYGYDNVNPDTNALGRYQFLKGALIDLGLKNPDGSWNTDTLFYQTYGIDSDSKFLNNESAQEDIMQAYIAREEYYTRNLYREYGGDIYIGLDGNKITVTQAGLIAAAHWEGQGNVSAYFDKYGGEDIPANTAKNQKDINIERRLEGAQNISYVSAGYPASIPNSRQRIK
jgi:hypothetical protein